MKIICLCSEGNSRSAACAFVLKQHGHEALAAGMRATSRNTRKMLFEWADVIILHLGALKHWIPEEYHHKVKVWDVGPDIFFRDYDESLKESFEHFLATDSPSKIDL